MKKILPLLIFLPLAFSCKKEKSNSGCTISMQSIAGSYRITAVGYKASSSSTEIDYYDQFFSDPCERDDILTFSTNGTWVQQDAGIVCSPSNDDNGNWSVSGQVMNVDGDDVDIKSFDCKKLVLVNILSPSTGEQFTLTLTRQ